MAFGIRIESGEGVSLGLTVEETQEGADGHGSAQEKTGLRDQGYPEVGPVQACVS